MLLVSPAARGLVARAVRQVGLLALAGAGCAARSGPLLEFDHPLSERIPVTINGRGPFEFGFDTGQSVPALLFAKTAAELDLPLIDEALASDGNDAAARTLRVVRVDRLGLGSADFRDVTTLVMDRESAERPGDAGALGFPLFADHLLMLDYPAGRMRVFAGALPRADGRTVLGYEPVNGLPSVRVRVGELTLPAIIDSGSQGEILLPLRYAKQLRLRAAPRVVGRMNTLFGEFDLLRAPLDGSVWIGAHELAAPDLMFSEHFAEANLGRGVLRHFCVTFDQQRQRVRLEQPARTSGSIRSGAPAGQT